MGQGVVDRLVEPLVGGINAGRADDLSLAATAPQLAEAAAGSRSLILGLRRRRPAPGVTTGPLFLGVAGGLGRLVDRLAAALAEAGVEICTDTAVTAIGPTAAAPAGTGWSPPTGRPWPRRPWSSPSPPSPPRPCSRGRCRRWPPTSSASGTRRWR